MNTEHPATSSYVLGHLDTHQCVRIRRGKVTSPWLESMEELNKWMQDNDIVSMNPIPSTEVTLRPPDSNTKDASQPQA